jgi:hypothetical protein
MFTMAGALVGIALNAIILYYLSRRNVRQYFSSKVGVKESSSTTTTTTTTNVGI